MPPSPASAASSRSAFRAAVHSQLDPRARPQGLSTANRVLIGAILVATALGVAETEPLLIDRYGAAFAVAELALGMAFATEYLARLWVSPEGCPDLPAWRARLRFAVSPSALADLVSTISCFVPAHSSSVLLLRWLRMARILRLAKLGRMSRALRHIAEALAARRDELLLSVGVGAALMLLSATALYMVEGPVRPEKFGSIPRAMWWAVATMTTIGYGDVYPITPLGKVLAGLAAVFSIGLIAMPTGILAAAFSEAVQRRRSGADS